jgi:hypothetical protein
MRRSNLHPLLLLTSLLLTRLSAAQLPTPQSKSSEQPVPSAKQTIEYRNADYGFCFTLPASWSGYSIVSGNWEGFANGENGSQTVTKGPTIAIKNPDAERQDIPIMIFTQSQWLAMQKGKFNVSAAPFPPSELGRNSRYVFALPARYNYAFPDGYEEVEKILSGKPLRACKSN